MLGATKDSHRQMHRLLLLPADDRIDVHLGYVRAVNRQRAPVIIDDKSRVLSHDIDAQVRRGVEKKL